MLFTVSTPRRLFQPGNSDKDVFQGEKQALLVLFLIAISGLELGLAASFFKHLEKTHAHHENCDLSSLTLHLSTTTK